jgi:phosphatidylethanolamine/phosphatidyl-N-methylethanolamine N-methyltransferase
MMTFSMAGTLEQYWRFFCAGLIRRTQTGAILPSQRFLVTQMLAPIPEDYPGRVFELGAGNGALTVRLAEKCPQATVVACEINPVLARDLRDKLARAGLGDRVQVARESAQPLLTRAREAGERVDFIFSGIPLANLGREPALELIRNIHSALRPGGLYIQFQHSLLDLKRIKTCFGQVRTVPVLLNLPPAFVYYARR